jgi:hypothetical protein
MREGWQQKSHARRVVSKRGAWIGAYSPASKQKNKAKHKLWFFAFGARPQETVDMITASYFNAKKLSC